MAMTVYINLWGQVIYCFRRRYVNSSGWFAVDMIESLIEDDPWYFGA